MSDGSAKNKPEILSLSMKLAFPNELDDFIGKVVREGAYLEEVLRECVAILGGLGNDVDVLLMGQSWDWLHSMAVGLQKEPSYATRRCNDEALPEIGVALSEANGVWKRRNAVVHASWRVCPASLGGTCEIAASNGGKVNEGEYHVERSIRRKFKRDVEHRHVSELEELACDFELVRQNLVEGLQAFDPNQFR
ncbi:hypothetical protein NCC78_02185 [Micromonospora phytophila]|uniref:hypothetical protein n=1 Tax=Micromonospora phytophila TaxID=709888 RepID=UPI0020308EB4|nr:hypothetical protein [Micromonospora phytophila]MCM0673532.1 hypothetical protein [Micromonospora phytophila]